jgi:hypothetical protein
LIRGPYFLGQFRAFARCEYLLDAGTGRRRVQRLEHRTNSLVKVLLGALSTVRPRALLHEPPELALLSVVLRRLAAVVGLPRGKIVQQQQDKRHMPMLIVGHPVKVGRPLLHQRLQLRPRVQQAQVNGRDGVRVRFNDGEGGGQGDVNVRKEADRLGVEERDAALPRIVSDALQHHLRSRRRDNG